MPKGPLLIVLSPLVGFMSVLMGISGGSFGVPVQHGYSPRSRYGCRVRRGYCGACSYWFFRQYKYGRTATDHWGGQSYRVRDHHYDDVGHCPWGVKLAHSMDAKSLKRAFGVFLVLVAVNMLRKALMC